MTVKEPTKIHPFPLRFQQQLWDVGFDAFEEVFQTQEFCAWLEANPLPAGEAYAFEFDDGSEVGITSDGPWDDDRHHGVKINYTNTH